MDMEKEKKRYEYYKNLHPDWSEEDIWLNVSIDKHVTDTVKNGGDDIDINTPKVMEYIIKKATDWIEENLPLIYEKVKAFFQTALNSVMEWASRGWEYLINLISASYS